MMGRPDMDALSVLREHRIVPVVTLARAEDAVPLARALIDAGIGAMEITLRTPAALEGIALVARQVCEMTVGAGSIRRVDQLDEVLAAGAGFAVSPGFSPALLDKVRDLGLPFVPGAATAAEMVQLLEAGYVLQKFFPAEQLGGVKTIRALSSPLPEVRFFPTGGINGDLLHDYLAIDVVACVGGSWFIDDSAIQAQDWRRLAELASHAVAAASR